jgi:hypothetical protein
MNGLLQDLRYALRQMRKSPVFFLIVVLTLGLGIGANTAIFSMVDWLVLRSLPITDPEQMHFLAFARHGANSEVQFSYPEFAEIQKQTTDVFSGITPFIFGGLAGAQNSQNGMTVDGTTESVQTAYGRKGRGRGPGSRFELQVLAESLRRQPRDRRESRFD